MLTLDDDDDDDDDNNNYDNHNNDNKDADKNDNIDNEVIILRMENDYDYYKDKIYSIKITSVMMQLMMMIPTIIKSSSVNQTITLNFYFYNKISIIKS